ncbi:branched-chain amino acid transaminase [Microbulbifer thermotolerans]|uniref:Branched-chain-amino-acid aminotransferase n=1 Tax=Microbulbifer thermotolerans TaxID=252514 RepID=A0A143HPV2_MICTH|nr:branched-chain amino acid transaminase [Microbulbifer thermotolerans]AMX03526.1 branched chain amino acid aminotransferase [Microbulbifer thermotolerans]MCX2778149.1 branched-chain amino acid transaminase [Microbulbifer thermotolerans]MCX2782217.1 branched-chain amino acid transaminase [Microbulbifer thermotolerans]MCX2795309.1 branched-chain amino acid transaminase [Microbulbifer thermotolerans]MCX2801129.1 branched-chain amino acid transaminase [Microbulbifer thermotolerans]
MSFADRDGVIWFDGELIPWRDARVHVLTHTLHYGMGVFEGVRAYQTESGTSIFRLQDHTRRLFRSAKIMNMAMPFDAEQLNEAQKLVVRENNLSEAYLRPMVFYGSEGMGLRADALRTHVIVAAWEWPSYMSPEARELGIKVNTSSYTRHHVNITMCKAKANGNYINSMLALQEAIRNGCEEALLLDPEGYVAEGSGENIFIVANGILYTPELTSCLDGITRNSVIELARECGYQVVEKRITRDEVYIADEAFFTGTAAEVLPIRMLDGRTIGAGRRGPITKRLQQLYFDVVQGRSQAHLGWLTDVAEVGLGETGRLAAV